MFYGMEGAVIRGVEVFVGGREGRGGGVVGGGDRGGEPGCGCGGVDGGGRRSWSLWVGVVGRCRRWGFQGCDCGTRGFWGSWRLRGSMRRLGERRGC